LLACDGRLNRIRTIHATSTPFTATVIVSHWIDNAATIQWQCEEASSTDGSVGDVCCSRYPREPSGRSGPHPLFCSLLRTIGRRRCLCRRLPDSQFPPKLVR